MDMANEELLSAWLRLSSRLWNERFVKGLSYNEAFVCNLLSSRLKESPQEPYMTAKELCFCTGLLKSQMNKTLNGLEKKGYIERRRFDSDRRLIHVRLLEPGSRAFLEEHRNILKVVDRVVCGLGESDARCMAVLMNKTAEIVGEIEREK